MNHWENRDKWYNLFKEPVFWNKNPLDWCDVCNTAIIHCEDKNCPCASCTGGSCEKCHESFKQFGSCKTHITDYLTPEEKKTYIKSQRLEQLIMNSLTLGESSIDFERAAKTGELSEDDYVLFNIPEEWKYKAKIV